MAPETIEETALVKVEELNAIELFTEGGIGNILAQIKEKIDQHISDVSTDAGRKEVASYAYRIARTKVSIDKLGKDSNDAAKALTNRVDLQRKRVRDTMEVWQKDVRRPLDEWEATEQAKKDAEKLAVEIEIDEEDAYKHEDFLRRQRELAAKEAEMARKESETKAKEEAERLERERERTEREARIAKEAKEKAEREANNAIERERSAKEKAERDAIEAAARAKVEQEAAVKEAEHKTKEEAEFKEAVRVAAEKAEKDKQERRAANKRHRTKVENDAVKALSDLLIGEVERTETDCIAEAQMIIEWVSKNRVTNITLNY